MDEPHDDSASQALIGDIDEFCKNNLGGVVQMVRAANGLPSAGDDYEFYSSFAGFREFVSYQKKRLLQNIGTLAKNQGLRDNFAAVTGQLSDIDEFTDRVIECNDGLLERVSALLDECSGYTQKEQQSNEQNLNLESAGTSTSAASASNTIISSWNKTDKYGKNKTFRLLHAQNILRPQLNFKTKIDNTNTPFVPIIKSKPNAIKPLPKALVDIHGKENTSNTGTSLAIISLIKQARQQKGEDLSIYEHPYQHELATWTPQPDQLEKVDPVKYSPLDQNSCIFIDKIDQINSLLNDLESSTVLAVDLEHHSYRSFQGITCLMQLSTRQKDYIVDTLALRSDLQILNKVFTNPKIVKVFHGADSDVLWLQRDLGIYIVNMFDTGQASRALQLERFSLNYLIHHYCSIEVDKKYQLADWRVRPLPEEMTYYAQADTHYLLYIYDLMRNQLINAANGQTNLLLHVLNKSRDLCLLRYEKPLLTPNSHLILLERQERRSSGKRNLRRPQQLEALRLLYAWRDAMARQEDESTGFVLPNHMLLQIAEILPREAQGVLACCNPIPPLVRQHVLAVHQFVVQAREKSISQSHPEEVSVSLETKPPFTAKADDEAENLLNNPHDLSHSNKSGKYKEFGEKSKTSGKGVRFFEKSTLFGPFSEKSTSLKGISVFGDGDVRCAISGLFTKQNNKDVQSKLDVLKNATWDPFALFMPQTKAPKRSSTLGGNASCGDHPLTLKHMLSGKFLWKMRQLNVSTEEHEATELKEDENQSKTFGKVVDIPENAVRNTEEQVQILRKIIKSGKEKKTNKAHSASPAASKSYYETEQDLRTVQQINQSDSKSRKREFGNRGQIMGRGRRGFRKPPGNVQTRPFVPYQYSDEDYKRFHTRGGMKKRKLNR